MEYISLCGSFAGPYAQTTKKEVMRSIVLYVVLLIFLSTCSGDHTLEVSTAYVNTNFWVRNEGAELYTTARGNPAAEVLVIYAHGGPLGGAHYTALRRPQFFADLEEEAIVIYYDQRGLGLSTGSFSADYITLAQYVEDLDHIVKVSRYKYPGKSVFIMGASWGGLLSCAYLLDVERQSDINGWINVNGSHDMRLLRTTIKNRLLEVADQQLAEGNDEEGWSDIRLAAEAYNEQDADFAALTTLWPKAEEGMALLATHKIINEETRFSGLSSFRATAYSSLEVLGNQLPVIADRMFQQMNVLDFAPDLEQIQIPSLFLWGEYDLIVPTQLAYDGIAQLGTGSEQKKLLVYPRIGHNSLAHPSAAADVISFIQQYK